MPEVIKSSDREDSEQKKGLKFALNLPAGCICCSHRSSKASEPGFLYGVSAHRIAQDNFSSLMFLLLILFLSVTLHMDSQVSLL